MMGDVMMLLTFIAGVGTFVGGYFLGYREGHYAGHGKGVGDAVDILEGD